jgi:hypothetical protein
MSSQYFSEQIDNCMRCLTGNSGPGWVAAVLKFTTLGNEEDYTAGFAQWLARQEDPPHRTKERILPWLQRQLEARRTELSRNRDLESGAVTKLLDLVVCGIPELINR